MTQVIEITHFKKLPDGKSEVSSKLTIDAALPKLNESGYPVVGGFFLKTVLKGKAMFVSFQEASELYVRLGFALQELAAKEYELRASKMKEKK